MDSNERAVSTHSTPLSAPGGSVIDRREFRDRGAWRDDDARIGGDLARSSSQESLGILRFHSESDLVSLVDAAMRDFSVTAIGPLADVCDGLVAGPLSEVLYSRGKRVRPLFAMYGAVLGGATELTADLLEVATAIELFHAFALIHDDIMDNADTRRGRPSLHRLYGNQLRGNEPGDPPANSSEEYMARSMGMLAGDLVLCWSQMKLQSGIDGCGSAQAVRVLFDQMVTEIMVGQAMDIYHERKFLGLTQETTTKIIEFKTSRYTFLRPLQIGAALSGAAPGTIHRFRDFALPLGRSFQLRDDLIGAFDDGSAGKSGTTDLECGKPTELMRYAVTAGESKDVAKLLSIVGTAAAADSAVAREILVKTGAVRHVINEIEKCAHSAMKALRELDCEPWLEQRLYAHLDRLLTVPSALAGVGTGTEAVA